jgi:hypothetical protein
VITAVHLTVTVIVDADMIAETGMIAIVGTELGTGMVQTGIDMREIDTTTGTATGMDEIEEPSDESVPIPETDEGTRKQEFIC